MGEIALKVGMSKAYGMIDWQYLVEVLKWLGFAPKWAHWIPVCVESVSFSVLFNRQPIGPVMPGRGIRQGDPLSPYLFILCSEGLTALINQAVARGDLHGVSIC